MSRVMQLMTDDIISKQSAFSATKFSLFLHVLTKHL